MKDVKDKYTKDLEVVFRGRPPSPARMDAKKRQQLLRKREKEQGIAPLQIKLQKSTIETWRIQASERGVKLNELIEQAVTAFLLTPR